MGNSSKGFRLDLGEPLAGELADFCVAHYGASQTNIIRVALEAFISERLVAEPAVAKRYEAARKKRIGGASSDKIRLLPGSQ